jgi:ABC-type multidrug transport system ATPase subunit
VEGLKIILENAGKRFNREVVFRGLNCTIEPGQRLAVLGSNGSGKSTLLQILSGFGTLSEGRISFFLNNIEIPRDEVFRHVSLATPYATVHEEMTLREAFTFHFAFKLPADGLTSNDLIDYMRLSDKADRFVKDFSSGMKQRVKLGLAIASATPLLLLDEPASNLDADNIAWYKDAIHRFGAGRTIIVCSNRMPDEYGFCSGELVVDEYK